MDNLCRRQHPNRSIICREFIAQVVTQKLSGDGAILKPGRPKVCEPAAEVNSPVAPVQAYEAILELFLDCFYVGGGLAERNLLTNGGAIRVMLRLATNRRRGGAVEGRGPLVRPDDAKRQTCYCG